MISAILLLMMGCTPADICEELREIRRYKEQRQPTCELVVEAALEFKIDPALLVAVAWHESRMNNSAVSRAGARGALQILPRWWCGSQRCDLIYNGARAFHRWRKRAKGNTLQALAMYNGGNKPGARSRRYAVAVMKTYRLLKRRLKRACNIPGC